MSENSEKINAEAAVFLKQGKEHFDKKEYGAAIEAFTKATELQPDFIAEMFFRRGLAYIELGKYTEAFEDSLTAVEKGFNDTGDAIIDAVFKNKPDLLWSTDCKRLNAASHYFLRLIASCIKQRRTTEKYQELIKAVCSL